MQLSISALVPTYRRPEELDRCLRAIASQSHLADDIIVVVREGDLETLELIRSFDPPLRSLRVVMIDKPGVVCALNAGLDWVRSDLVAITDDDAVPDRDWLKQLVKYFEADSLIGGVGGRDRMFVAGVLQDGRQRTVGKVPAIGRHVGNHHLGFGPAREVDVLKGVNCAYRTMAVRAVGFDRRMRGNGAQVHWEISLGGALTRAGWKLVYDPAITVDHFPAQRFDEDQRRTFNPIAMENGAYNEMIARMDSRSEASAVALVCWAVLIGTRDAPGLLQWLRFVPMHGALATRKCRSAVKGRLEALRDFTMMKRAHSVNQALSSNESS